MRNGQQQFLGGLGGEPNGLAMMDDGTIIVANIGTGTIQKLHPAASSSYAASVIGERNDTMVGRRGDKEWERLSLVGSARLRKSHKGRLQNSANGLHKGIRGFKRHKVTNAR